MPVDIIQLSDGWLELESDPGLFTLLLEDFGVKGVQVEEIYDLQKPIENPVYGFIFLFRWTEDRRSRRKIIDKGNTFVKDEDVVNNLFFAEQKVPNSCATHALLSVLLNCPKIQLGETLNRLKTHTVGMNPENKGWAIGNTPELAKAHNLHATPQARHKMDKSTGISTGKFVGDAYHFVSYVPINGQLFELDGLKPYPIDHGPWKEYEDWTDKFKRVIKDRLGVTADEANNDIRYNLMAVVPDRRLALTHKINMLRTNRQIVLEAHQQLQQLNTTCALSPTTSKQDSQISPGGSKRPLLSPQKAKSESETHTANKLLKTSGKLGKPAVKPELVCDKSKDSSSEGDQSSKISVVVTGPDNADKKVEFPEKKPDYSTPLTIQTSPAPSSSSTDTSSEVGSAFNSPGQNSPCTKDFNKFVVIRVAMGDVGESGSKSKESAVRKVCLEAGALPAGWEKPSSLRVPGGMRMSPLAAEKKPEEQSMTGEKTVEPAHHTFAPKDLLALVKNLEAEISVCEAQLRDEHEKRKQYKIDDSRRIHNYDQFIRTFLSMLAQTGKLADHLVQQHLTSVQRKQLNPVGSSILAPLSKKQITTTKKKRGRTKGHTKK
ncbi:ubiquitin carboxyl-terminal hydrolase calypso [Planococcus citri]|uniref:ubiquitin carboxyl-terminal hydrolase calypso n=1 Tax=Planococcus citri TaxID=170843 RepID=UPI0031F8808A